MVCSTCRTAFGADGEVWGDVTTGNAMQSRHLRVGRKERQGARITGANVVARLDAGRLGSLRLVTDRAGALRDLLTYTTFGKAVAETASAWVRKGLVFDADKMLSPAVFDPSLLACLSLYAAASLAVSRAAPLGGERREGLVAGLAWGVKVALVVLAICLAPGRQSAPFIYFQL
jgi:hypothetical protein